MTKSVQMSTNGTENLQHSLEGNDCPSALQHRKPFRMLNPNREQQKHRAFLSISLNSVLPFKASAS